MNNMTIEKTIELYKNIDSEELLIKIYLSSRDFNINQPEHAIKDNIFILFDVFPYLYIIDNNKTIEFETLEELILIQNKFKLEKELTLEVDRLNLKLTKINNECINLLKENTALLKENIELHKTK